MERTLKVSIMYLDLTTDVILLCIVMATASWDNFRNFNLFPNQIALILLASIIVPLVLSAIMIAYKRPLVILDTKQWKTLSRDKNRNLILKARIVIVLFFPFVPAMILHSRENEEEQRKSLKGKDWEKEEQLKNCVLEECEELSEFLNEILRSSGTVLFGAPFVTRLVTVSDSNLSSGIEKF